jgi:hypothetical protein
MATRMERTTTVQNKRVGNLNVKGNSVKRSDSRDRVTLTRSPKGGSELNQGRTIRMGWKGWRCSKEGGWRRKG